MELAIRSFNVELPGLVTEYTARGLNLQLHDVNAAAQWTDGDYWIWGIHFNSTGFEKMASAWREAIRSAIQMPREEAALNAGQPR